MKQQFFEGFLGGDYDFFGMMIVGRSWSGGSEFRYGFNAQEQDDEVYGNGNLNTARFWEYDTRLGRRWNIDPVVIPYLSTYSTFNNNPVNFMDPKGDTFEEGKEKAENMKVEAKKRIEIENLIQSNLQEKIEARIEKGRNVEKLQNRLSYSKFKENEFQATINEINRMDESKVKYAIRDGFNKTGDVLGETFYENSTGFIVMQYGGSANNGSALLAHELKHGYQFLVGDLDFRADIKASGYLVDLSDEVQAYTRQRAWSLTSLGFEGKYNIDQAWVARYRGYSDNPNGPLNINTTMHIINAGYVHRGLKPIFDKGNLPTTSLLTTYKDWSLVGGTTKYISIANYSKF